MPCQVTNRFIEQATIIEYNNWYITCLPVGGYETMKIYVRPRTKVGEGVHQPMFKVIATTGDGSGKIKFQAKHLRKSELEQIAEDMGATLVYLEPTPGTGSGGKKE